MEKILYKLNKFEGPLDLLLHLIQKNKVSIYDIPIAEITDQYMEAIDELDEEKLDNASEFVVLAAQLLYIKSKMLLPKPERMKRKIPEKILYAVWRNINCLKRLPESLEKPNFHPDI